MKQKNPKEGVRPESLYAILIKGNTFFGDDKINEKKIFFFKLRASHLQSRHPTTLVTPPVHFALVILEMEALQSICVGWPCTPST
jgi:hypothetical protein